MGKPCRRMVSGADGSMSGEATEAGADRVMLRRIEVVCGQNSDSVWEEKGSLRCYARMLGGYSSLQAIHDFSGPGRAGRISAAGYPVRFRLFELTTCGGGGDSMHA